MTAPIDDDFDHNRAAALIAAIFEWWSPEDLRQLVKEMEAASAGDALQLQPDRRAGANKDLHGGDISRQGPLHAFARP